MRLADTVAAALLARLPAHAGAAAVRRGASTLVGVEPDEVAVSNGPETLRVLDSLAPGLWVGWLAYELGHALERVVPRQASLEDPAVPDAVFARFGALLGVDPNGGITVWGDGAGRGVLEQAARDVAVDGCVERVPPASGAWHTSLDRDSFESRVEAILELLRAGECYQVNLTRRLTVDSSYDPVALYAELARRHAAPYTGMLRLPLSWQKVSGRPTAVVCASTRAVPLVERARGGDEAHQGHEHQRGVAPRESKDRAENVMIVDLARNDLGRVCEPGSIQVPSLCDLEAHPGLHHLVSTVRGTLRPGVGTGSFVAATFPPASITGAPKPRVMQAIEELEPVRRGVYCGAFGWLDTARGEGDLAVAIRTFTMFGDRTELGVGSGIVADSSPAAEWEETELKASRLLAVAGAGELVPT